MSEVIDIYTPSHVRALVAADDPALTSVMPQFDFAHPPTDPVVLARMLVETMMEHKGLGLAAPQIGLYYNAFAMHTDPLTVCFNPRIVDASTEASYMMEGCLSFKGLALKVKRSNAIRARYTLPNGETVTKEYAGLTARIFQHEFDHLQGILFQKRATRYHLEQGLNHKRRRMK